MIFDHRTTASFWDCYNKLSEDLRYRADKQFDRLDENFNHPSLQLKPVGAFWSARVTDACRVWPYVKKTHSPGFGLGLMTSTSAF